MSDSRLENRDYGVLIDTSGSMVKTDTSNGRSRWDSAREGTIALASKVSKLDSDGIKLVTFANTFKVFENTDPQAVERIFNEREPMGGTILAPALNACFTDYLARKKAGTTKPNGELLIVVTDGEPEDQEAVAKAIANFTKSLDNGDGEYGISFIQVGKDAGASRFLQMLDDDLTKKYGAAYDIVDTKKMDEVENITEALVAALDD